MPDDLRRHVDKVLEGRALMVAHNAGFDRTIWNNSTDGFPRLEPHHWIDTRAQATAAGLPPDLDAAARYATGSGKLDAGKNLIRLFCEPESIGTPRTHPDEWAQFLAYAMRDIAAMRDLFTHTPQLPLAVWREYWAAEVINDRGVCIDVELAEAAARMAALARDISNVDMIMLTKGKVRSVDSVKPLKKWLWHTLPSDCRDIMAAAPDPDEPVGEDDGADASLMRNRVERMIAWLKARETLTDAEQAALRVLEIRLYGGSKTPAKFGKMAQSHVDGVIRGQYVFGGAAQTGRFSARGIQIHNLMRDALPDEADAIDSLLAGATPEEFAGDMHITRRLSMLIRPTLVAPPGYALVWGDWSNIEARITPWLAPGDPDAEDRLEIFRRVDSGEERYDIYTRTAAELSGLTLDEAKESKVRQRGKVVELAAGFGGGRGALLAMAAGYGMHLSDDTADEAVARWRAANPWAVKLWGKDAGEDDALSFGLWGAACRALRNPGRTITCGRVSYLFIRGLLGGTLVCRLPSGRWLTYRKCHWEMVAQHDDPEDPKRVTGYRRELTYARDHGRAKLWHGVLIENIVQATAADILRGTLVRLEQAKMASWMPVRLHTHDEVLVEAIEADTAPAAVALRDFMEMGFDWTEGLPLAAETTIGRWYSKCKASWGL